MDTSAHNAVAAAFSDREIAHACYEALEREGFPHRWMAVTKPADTEAWGDGSAESTSENDIVASSAGALGAIGRVFSGEGNSLRRSLEDHGIATDEAIAIDEALHLGGAVVVVAADERRELAASILRDGGGLFYGAEGDPAAAYDVAADSFAGATPQAQDDAAATADANRTLELREERLQIDKHTVAVGEATVGTRVVSESVAVDVPVEHEELFIERHAVESGRAASGAIGTDETIHVPLEHVRETLAHEELEVAKPASTLPK